MPRTLTTAALAAALAGALTLPAAAGAVTPVTPPFQKIADSTGGGPVSADAGWVAYTDERPDSYVLTVIDPEGRTTHPKIAGRGLPFDVDLGPGPNGDETAVYSRCSSVDNTPSRRRGCRISRLDLVTGKETTVRLGPGSRSEYLPSIHGDTLAYVSIPARGTKVGNLVVRSLRTGRVTIEQTHPVKGESPTYGPFAVDTDGRNVVAQWTVDGSTISDIPSFDYVIYTQRIGGKARIGDLTEVTADGCGNEDYVGATLFGGAAYTIIEGGRGWQLERITLGGAKPIRTFGPKVLYPADPPAAGDGTPSGPPSGFGLDGQGYVVTKDAITHFTLGAFVKKGADVFDDSGCA